GGELVGVELLVAAVDNDRGRSAGVAVERAVRRPERAGGGRVAGLEAGRWGPELAAAVGRGVGTVRGGHEAGVDLADEASLQHEHGDAADDEADQGQQRDQGGEEAAPERHPGPPAPEPSGGAVRGGPGRRGHGAGLSTYPTPRMVWIIGRRPASIFLRR